MGEDSVMQGNSLLAAVEVAKQAGVLPIDTQGPQNTDENNKKEINEFSIQIFGMDGQRKELYRSQL